MVCLSGACVMFDPHDEVLKLPGSFRILALALLDICIEVKWIALSDAWCYV